VRDYNPPPTPMMHPGGGQGHPESPMYSTIPSKWPQNLQQSATSVLNVADPRYSAAYGNPLLRQNNTTPRGMQYSTFMPGPMMGGPAPPMAPQVPLNSSTAYLASSGGQGFPPPHLNGSLPMSSRTQVPPSSGSAQGSTTPNSSISNMACLPEGDNLSNSVTGTPSPPPAPTLSAMASTTAIYARVNPNLKRDKTNNNNFTSTFTTPPAASTQQPQRPEAVTSSINTHSALGGNGDNRMGPVNPSLTNGCVHQQQQPPRSQTASNPTASNSTGSAVHTINSSVGTHV